MLYIAIRKVDNVAMDKKEVIAKFNKFKGISLQNAEDLLKASKASLDAGIDHASFHLTLLSLEEIGKVEMEVLRLMSLLHPKREPMKLNLAVDDHEKKLFFTFWGHSFGREKQTKQLIENNQHLAKNLHNSRLLYLYSDPANPHHWSELMAKDEARKIYELAELRLKLAQSTGDLDTEKLLEPDDNLIWFFNAQEDDQKKKEIWGHKSQEKLLELNDVKEWIKWLREIYDKNEQEMREISEKELRRQEPPEEEKLDPKWKLSIEITTPSHSIRQKNLKQFNDGVTWIKLKYKDSNTLGIDFTLSKNIPIQGLYWHGWGIARMFAVALNISTNGFFWWNIKRDPSKYYEEIFDLENKTHVRVEPTPRLEMNWRDKHLVLREVDLSLTSIIFSYLGNCRAEHKEKHLDHYVAGLTMLAKNDIHLRLEMNSFEEFFKALKLAMIANGDWDQKQPFEEAYQKATSWRFKEITEEMRKMFPLGFKVESEHKDFVDLTGVYAMKNYCEIYFQTLAVRYIEKKEGQQVRIVVSEDTDETDENTPKS
jgi:AbiV family abortive infection protein